MARQLDRKGGRKRRIADSKIKSTKKLLVSGVAKDLGASVPTLCPWIRALARSTYIKFTSLRRPLFAALLSRLSETVIDTQPSMS